jgi:AmmeMemoRadiSam system protein B
MGSIRPAAVAGLFYPDNPRQLTADIDQFLTDASSQIPKLAQQPKALIVPHAGFVYSGSTAAKAYAALSPFADAIQRVVLIGPAHRVWVDGIAMMDVEAFRTPLGDISIDQAGQQQLSRLHYVHFFDQAHWQEHCLEVQLPFLQKVLNDFSLLPLLVGEASPEQVATALATFWDDPRSLLLISSDLSHFLSYQQAQQVDRKTCQAIEAMDISAIHNDQACGNRAVKGLLTLAKEKQMEVITLGLCNSGDTAGDHSRVVGYGSWAFVDRHVH